ncbi:HET-domain-containing protein [Mytilinidion resinicola]|uniref:HET-domain-containing protein n=1 Tax=Mytilinidion resinicola TaxID=574789 RepID=A0A6A6XZX6_9PEZI|nr:HET-domain-containing protein [Mytilinidion resinicola]KAF2802111.1 HET-domain-containing protein [Mytilinidion resinicola]
MASLLYSSGTTDDESLMVVQTDSHVQSHVCSVCTQHPESFSSLPYPGIRPVGPQYRVPRSVADIVASYNSGCHFCTLLLGCADAKLRTPIRHGTPTFIRFDGAVGAYPDPEQYSKLEYSVLDDENKVLVGFMVCYCPSLVQNSYYATISARIRVEHVTLSHRWSREHMPKLLSFNVASMRSHVPAESVAGSFADAVTVVRRLDIRYLWIDALCIVQDDVDDWRRESAMMGEIYKGAACNLAATAAGERENPDTLFIDGAPLLKSILTTEIKGTTYHFFTETTELSFLSLATLNTRGRVLQERLLSPQLSILATSCTGNAASSEHQRHFLQGVQT